MANTNEKNELKMIMKTSDIFDKALNALFWIFLVCACIAGLFAVLSFIPGIPMDRLVNISEMHLQAEFIRFTFADSVFDMNPRMLLIYTCAIMMVPAAFMAAICRAMKGVIAPLKEGRPFTNEVSCGIKKIAWIYLAGEVTGCIVSGIVGTVFFKAYNLGSIFLNDFVTSVALDINEDVNILVPVLLFMISWIVKYGENLQKLEDETL